MTDVSAGFRPPCWCLSRWAQAWRLRTNLYKFEENVSLHIFHEKNCCDLNLGESLCIYKERWTKTSLRARPHKTKINEWTKMAVNLNVFKTSKKDYILSKWNFFRRSSLDDILLVFSVTPFKIDQNKKSKPFNRLSPESGNRKKVDMQRLSPRFRSQQFFLWKICGETFYPNL